MNLQSLLAARIEAGKPVRAGLIGAGKFGSMFLAQCPRSRALRSRSLPISIRSAPSLPARPSAGTTARISRTHFADDGRAAIADGRVDVVIEATGSPNAGIGMRSRRSGRARTSLWSMSSRVLAGPLLARKAREAGVIYSMAYGDQPALIAEMVDWAARPALLSPPPARAPNPRLSRASRRTAYGSTMGSRPRKPRRPA